LLNIPSIRIGRLLEVLDGLVGLVAYRYCYSDFTNSNNRPLTIVTLSVNNFSLHTKEIDIFTDICLNSYVAYIGKSSLEIYSDLYQNEKIVASVQFLMVGRNAQDYTKVSLSFKIIC
jgi:acyl-coenzyme A thioesterase 9